MIERVAKRGRDSSRESQEFFVIAGVAGNEVFWHPVGTHRSPFVMVPVTALGQPDPGQVFEASVTGDIARRKMAMVIENRLGLGELELQLFSGTVREQKILGQEGSVHGCAARV